MNKESQHIRLNCPEANEKKVRKTQPTGPQTLRGGRGRKGDDATFAPPKGKKVEKRKSQVNSSAGLKAKLDNQRTKFYTELLHSRGGIAKQWNQGCIKLTHGKG